MWLVCIKNFKVGRYKNIRIQVVDPLMLFLRNMCSNKIGAPVYYSIY